MNLTTEIKFSNNLIKNKNAYISYSGNLYKQNSNSVYIVYGYGNNWNHTTEQKMIKNSNGFVAKINMLNFDNFNFCFRNQNYEWDNNNGSNYNVPITEEPEDYEENFIINEDIITEVADNLFKYDISQIPTPKKRPINSLNSVAQELFSDIYKNNESFEKISNTNIQTDVEPIEIIDDAPVNVEIVPEVSNFIESVINEEITDEINTDVNDNVSDEDIFKIVIEDLDENVIDDVVENKIENVVDDVVENKIENVVDDVVENITNNTTLEITNNIIENNYEDDVKETIKENSFNMDSLIEEILTPITSSKNFEKEDLDSLKKNTSYDFDLSKVLTIQDDEKEIEKDKKIDNIINNYLDNIYENLDKNSIKEKNDNKKAINKLEQIEQLDVDELSFEETDSVETPVEESIIESTLNSSQPVSTEKSMIVSPRHVTPFYMTKKKVKLAFLKIFNFLPRLISGKYSEDK